MLRPVGSTLRAGLALLGTSASLGCAVLESPVARSVDGVTTEGRFIDPEAYAFYAIAATHEARGRWQKAMDFYQRALEFDSRGPELSTRLGAVACRLGKKQQAERAFSRALEADAEYAPGWFELAVCLRAQGDIAGARRATSEALKFDPERYEVSLLAAELEDLRGDTAAARRLRDALASHAPRSHEVHRALLAVAIRQHDAPRRERAETALAQLVHGPAQLSLKSPVALALEALQRGDLASARGQTEQLLKADAGNGDALVVALTAADLAQDEAAFGLLLEQAELSHFPISAATQGLLSSLLARRIGRELGQISPTPEALAEPRR